jgi:heme exporter protein B
VCFPVYGIFYNVRWTQQFWPLLLVAVLGTWGITVIGTMFSALTVNLRLREVMLPLLVYPMMIPCLMAAMKLSNQLIGGDALDSEAMIWMRFLIGFDVIFTSLALMLVEIVLVG